MPKLYVLSGPDIGAAFDVTEGALIGRSPACAVCLSDASISRRHARFERRGGHWNLVDLDSRNGLFQGGKRLQRAFLVDLDEVLLGEVRLRFRDAQPKSGSEDAVQRSPRPAATAPRSSTGAESEIELEEDIDLRVPRAPARQVQSARRAQILSDSSSRGSFLTDALEDRPLWITSLAVLFVLALCAGIAFAMFHLVTNARAG